MALSPCCSRRSTPKPNNAGFKVEWADVLLLQGDVEGGRTVLATIPEETEERERPAARLELLEEAASYGDLGDALRSAQADEGDLEARYRAAVLLGAARRYAEALDHAMAILQRGPFVPRRRGATHHDPHHGLDGAWLGHRQALPAADVQLPALKPERRRVSIEWTLTSLLQGTFAQRSCDRNTRWFSRCGRCRVVVFYDNMMKSLMKQT